ncbi:MAG: hypothetical protein JWN76_808 [Chitinophagaceae bacterium]|nr:hypothetical protein [Chitinophagaceae bacterium]
MYMRSMRPCFYQCIFFLLNSFTSNGQDKQGKLTGTVSDSTKKPLPYATVSLYRAGQLTEPIKRTYTNTKGNFQLTADTGKYQLIISHTGFGEANTPVHIKSGDNEIAGLVLTASIHSLQNITVTARKALIEQSDDKLIYNVENDPAAKSESASDILRKTPLVMVDGEGNVQVNGQSNFKILLNGRETSMFAMNLKDALKNFPGAVISKIEVITSPSAKYDAEGVGGVINIITKKKVIGYNGYLSSYYSTNTDFSESATLNLKSGKLGITGYVSTSGSGDITSRSTSETTPVGAAIFSKRTLTGERTARNLGGFGNVEVSYEIDSLNTLATYVNFWRFKQNSTLQQTVITEHGAQPFETGYYTQGNRSENANTGIGADFIRKYKSNPEKELDFRFNGQSSKNNGFNNSLQDNPASDRYVSNTSEAKNHEYTFAIDFIQPLQAKRKIETGTKAILRNASSDFKSLVKYNTADNYKLNPSNTDVFNYHQEVYSAYASYNFYLGKYNIRSGLRLEHTDISGDFITSKTIVSQHYTDLIPNVVITRRFSSLYTLTASYNLRLQRPYITNLNPFVNNTDSLNISYGNPNLGPQTLHSVSVQNRFTKGKLFAAVSLNGSYTNSMIVQYAAFNKNSGVTSYTSANAGKEYQASIGLNLNTPLNDKLTVGLYSLLRYNDIENKFNLLQHRKGLSGSAFGNFYYKVVGNFTISGSGGVNRSPYALVNTPNTQAFYQVNFGYKFFHEKLSATINVNNFHKQFVNYRSVTEDPNFRIVSSTISPYRVIYFGVTYNFGKLKENVSKKKGVSNDDLVQ